MRYLVHSSCTLEAEDDADGCNWDDRVEASIVCRSWPDAAGAWYVNVDAVTLLCSNGWSPAHSCSYGRFILACLFTRMMRTLPGSEGKFISTCVTMPPMSHIFIYSRCPSQARLWVRWLFRSTPFSIRFTVVTQRTHRGYSVFSHFLCSVCAIIVEFLASM